MLKEASMRGFIRSLLLAASVWSAGVGIAQAVELQWWSHWAIEDNKKVVLFEAKRRFEQRNPGHTVTITFYEKKNMFTALRAAFTAGSGFPDVLYYDIDAPEFMQAGWMADLSTGVRWENVEPYGKAFWTRPGPGGKTGVWALPLEAAADELYYYKELIDLGAYAKTLSSMTLAEAHRYFHTEQKACMFPVGSWYTGRAFVPQDKGGQPKDFELGMMNYPLMKDGKGHNQKLLGVAGSLGAAAKSPNLALAVKVVDAFADVEVGNLWMAKTGVQTGIKTDVSKIDSPFKSYFDEYARVNKTSKWVDLTAQQVRLQMKPGVWDTYVAAVNQGLPNKLIGADEALAKLEEARLKGK